MNFLLLNSRHNALYSAPFPVIYLLDSTKIWLSFSPLQKRDVLSGKVARHRFRIIRSFTFLPANMTSIDYRSMMKKARANAKGQSGATTSELDPTMDMETSATQKASGEASNYVVESYAYDTEEEIASFHSLFAQWKVGSVEHVYYIPNFVTEEEETFLLSNVRQPCLL